VAETEKTAWHDAKRYWGVVVFLAAALLFLLGRARTGRPVELSFAAETAQTRLCRRCAQRFLSADGRCTVCGCRDSSALPEAARKRAQTTPVGPSVRIQQPPDLDALKAKKKGPAK
jgi:hypothetical protein